MNNCIPPGKHLIIDIKTQINLSDPILIKECLESAALACKATILESNLHHFGVGLGVTGVIILAESHISIHTWPELNFAAVDIFMCGSCDPYQGIPVLQKFFDTSDIKIREVLRNI